MTRYLLCSLVILVFFPSFLLCAATEISGKITAKRGDSVQVTFEPHQTAGPAIGDTVSFSLEIPGAGGIRAKAGEGTVTEVDGTTVWVKTSDNRPNLRMDAVVQATGTMIRALPQTLSKSGSLSVANPSEIRAEILKELIRLHYISAGTKDVPSETLRQAVDLCGMLEGFAKGHPINEELLQRLKSIDSK